MPTRYKCHCPNKYSWGKGRGLLKDLLANIISNICVHVHIMTDSDVDKASIDNVDAEDSDIDTDQC